MVLLLVLRTLHESLEQGVLVAEKDGFVFTQDYRFNSSSLAASVVTASSVSGPEMWKDEHGRALRELQAADIG